MNITTVLGQLGVDTSIKVTEDALRKQMKLLHDIASAPEDMACPLPRQRIDFLVSAGLVEQIPGGNVACVIPTQESYRALEVYQSIQQQ